jgi:AcrR family transcriptional regulator
MGVQERKQRERDAKKNLIRQAAIDLFLSEGVENITIRRIAEKIEFAPATIYLYFKDKGDILMDLHDEGFRLLIEYLKMAKGSDDMINEMKASSTSYVNFAIENPGYYNLIFIMSYKQKGLSSPDEWEGGRIAYNILRTKVLKCIEQDIIKNEDPEEITFSIWSFIHGISSILISQDGGPVKLDDKKTFAAKAVSFFYENLRK